MVMAEYKCKYHPKGCPYYVRSPDTICTNCVVIKPSLLYPTPQTVLGTWSFTASQYLTCIKRLGLRAVGTESVWTSEGGSGINLPTGLRVPAPGRIFELQNKCLALDMSESGRIKCKYYDICKNYVRVPEIPCAECVVRDRFSSCSLSIESHHISSNAS